MCFPQWFYFGWKTNKTLDRRKPRFSIQSKAMWRTVPSRSPVHTVGKSNLLYMIQLHTAITSHILPYPDNIGYCMFTFLIFLKLLHGFTRKVHSNLVLVALKYNSSYIYFTSSYIDELYNERWRLWDTIKL